MSVCVRVWRACVCLVLMFCTFECVCVCGMPEELKDRLAEEEGDHAQAARERDELAREKQQWLREKETVAVAHQTVADERASLLSQLQEAIKVCFRVCVYVCVCCCCCRCLFVVCACEWFCVVVLCECVVLCP